MNYATRKLRDKATTSTLEYKNQLLEDFLAYAKNFQKSINYLLENGKTEDGYICLDDLGAASLGASVFFSREHARQVQCTLSILNKDNVIDVFTSIYQISPHFTFFPEFLKMQNLAHNISNCIDALDEILNG